MKKIVSIILLIINIFILSGCWDYEEIDRIAIIGGLAIDKDMITNKFIITVEVDSTDVSMSKSGEIKAQVYESEGDSVMDASKNLISVMGRKAYWSHAKVVIIGKEVSERDLSIALDWIYRSYGVRDSINVIISNKDKAGDILKTNPELENTVSYHLYAALQSQKDSYKFPKIELWEVIKHIRLKDTAAIIPLVDIDKHTNKKTARISGSGILKEGKIIGYISPLETQDVLWIQGIVKGGVFVISNSDRQNNITFEIYANKNRVDFITDNGIKIQVKIHTDISVAEINGQIDFRNKEKREKIINDSENIVKERLESVIKKVQKEYQCDIFNFGEKLRVQNKKIWNSAKDNWDEEFTTVPIEVNVEFYLRNSSTVTKPVKEDE